MLAKHPELLELVTEGVSGDAYCDLAGWVELLPMLLMCKENANNDARQLL